MTDTLDIKEVLAKMGYTVFSETATHFLTRPLYRDSDNNKALAIDKRTGEWFDFVERVGGTIHMLIAKTLDLRTPEKVTEFLDGQDIALAVKNHYELDTVKTFDKQLLLKLRKDHTYWEHRGVSAQTIATFEGGTTSNGRMKYRYVFPIFNDRDDVIGFSGRSLLNYTSVPKWKHIGAKSNWCYPLKWNRTHILRHREIILVESIGDMLALWEAGVYHAIVTFGVSISPSIIQLLLKMDAQRILIAFNNDSHNNRVGNNAARDERLRLCRYFDTHQVVVAVPEGKDFGEMDAEQIALWKTQFSIPN
jgi:DNA primase